MFDAVQPRKTSPIAYLFAVIGVAVASGAILALPLLMQRGAFVLLLAVTSLVSWFAGWRPGLLAVALSALAGAWFILPPTNSLLVTNPEDMVRLGLFVVVAGMILLLHRSRQVATEQTWMTEQRLAFAMQVTGMGAWCSDLKTGQFWWSEGMEQLFGRPAGEFASTYDGFVGYIHPDDQDFVKRAITHTTDDGKDFEIEHRIVRPDGQTRWILTRGRLVLDQNGNPMRIIGVASDISERKAHGAAAQVAGSETDTRKATSGRRDT